MFIMNHGANWALIFQHGLFCFFFFFLQLILFLCEIITYNDQVPQIDLFRSWLIPIVLPNFSLSPNDGIAMNRISIFSTLRLFMSQHYEDN